MPTEYKKQLTAPGATILTYSGVMIDLLNPDPADINLTDISHGLAFTCRYAAQSRQFCSVAQHSVHVLEYVRHHGPNDPKIHAWALLHDAAEAYLGDWPTPLKRMSEQYQEMEKTMLDAIMTRFNLPLESPDIVHKADAVVLHWEWPAVMAVHPDVEPAPVETPFKHLTWQPKTPLESRDLFRKYAEALGLYGV